MVTSKFLFPKNLMRTKKPGIRNFLLKVVKKFISIQQFTIKLLIENSL